MAGEDPASPPVRWLPSAGENASASELVSRSPPARWPTPTGENASAFELVSGLPPARQPTSSGAQASVLEAHQDGGEGGRSARHRTADERRNMRLLQAVESFSVSTARLVSSLNSVDVSSHACVSRVVSASASARAPAAPGFSLAFSPAAFDARLYGLIQL